MAKEFLETVEIDINSLQALFEYGASTAISLPSPRESNTCQVFEHTISLTKTDPDELEFNLKESDESIQVSLTIGEPDQIKIVLPKEIRLMLEARNSPSTPLAKRRKKSRKPTSPETFATIGNLEETIVEDLLLCSSISKSRLPIALSEGPFIVRNPKGHIFLTASLHFVADEKISSRHQQNIALKFLSRVFEDPSLIDPLRYQASPLDLIRIITKAPKISSTPKIKPPGLRTDLLPYQRESVNWCLRREGKQLVNPSEVSDLDISIRDCIVSPPLGWRKLPNSEFWVNPYLLRTSSSEPQFGLSAAQPQTKHEYQGRGILAEEMGLGKTLEMISLISLNPRKSFDDPDTLNPSSTRRLYRSKATLVIVPRTILHQWVSEVEMHAPRLKILILSDPNPPIEALLEADVVLVTYNQLSRWLPYTSIKQKAEARKNRVKFTPLFGDDNGDDESSWTENNRSTLVDVEFWRVILDEVQMVHTGSSAAAQVARRIARVHAWAASGTPVKHSLEDLRGITYFLDLFPFVERPCWQRLISSPIDFEHTMEHVAIRHTKAMVADQLHIPKQHRRLILLKFSAIERARYDRLYKDFLEDAKNSNCNLSAWLLRLRQLCSHAVAAGGNNTLPSNLGTGVGGEVVALTLDQVLVQLVDEADLEVWTEQREKFNLQLQLGQLYDISYQMPLALEEWKSVVEHVSAQLTNEEPKLNQYKNEAKALQERVDALEKEAKISSDGNIESDDDDDDDLDIDAGDSHDHDDNKNRSTVQQAQDTSAVKLEPTEATGKEAMEAKMQKMRNDAALFDTKRALAISNNRLKSVRLRCKLLKELLHRAYFFLGTGYFRSTKRLKMALKQEELDAEDVQATVKANFAEETKYYGLAEEMRGKILNETAERVTELVKKPLSFTYLKVYKHCPIPKATIADQLSAFASELDRKLKDILTQPLMEETTAHESEQQSSSHSASTTKETNGDKNNEDSKEAGKAEETDAYAKTLDLQEYAFVYLEMLQILIRDRAATINGGNIQPTPSNISAGDGEIETLAAELISRREEIVSLLQYDRVPLTSLMRSSGTSESTIRELKAEVKKSQKRYAFYKDLYNSRVEYYKQLQDLSDQVTDIDVGKRTDYDKLIMQKVRDINLVDHRIQEKHANHAYLRNLEGSNSGLLPQKRAPDSKHNIHHENNDEESEEYKCPICLEFIKDGALTPCGHLFSEECLFSWLATRHSCPLCNRKVNPSEVHKFRIGDEQALDSLKGSIDKGREGQHQSNDADETYASDLFIPISTKLYNRIHQTPIERMYGVKIDMIVKHAQYIRSQDPSAQIVVFSQWGTMLKGLKTAFSENQIMVGTPNGLDCDVNDFRTNPDVACLLLHAKADVAGLTLVNANHVFLCEPLMNTAIELQAVSRINRIGQTRETTVWQFCVEDTVEQTILGITTKERLVHSTINGTEELDESTTIAHAATQGNLVDKRSGAEIVGDSELRRILFRNQES